MDIEQKVNTKLLMRGFSKENLINNRGLIGATTDETILEVVKNLGIANVSGSLLSDLDYWKQRCELAEKCLEESPCDPDMTSDQIKAHNAYNKFISNFGNDR